VPPAQARPVSSFPVITGFSIDTQVRLTGSGFVEGDHLEALDLNTGACLTFNKPIKIKKSGTVLLQRGRLSDGRTISDAEEDIVIRFVHRDGTAILLTSVQAVAGP
jgi:hypothetical protein